MIHIVLPVQYSSGTRLGLTEPHKRLMVAVLQAAVDDYRGGSAYRRSVGKGVVDAADVRKAIAYVTSTDRGWPFSFENLCEALGVDADGLREGLDAVRVPARPRSTVTTKGLPWHTHRSAPARTVRPRSRTSRGSQAVR